RRSANTVGDPASVDGGSVVPPETTGAASLVAALSASSATRAPAAGNERAAVWSARARRGTRRARPPAARNDRPVRSIGHPRPPENAQPGQRRSIFGARRERRTAGRNINPLHGGRPVARPGGRELITQTTTGVDQFLRPRGDEKIDQAERRPRSARARNCSAARFHPSG